MSVARARRWLEQVARDLNAARNCARGEVPETGHAAFWIQQNDQGTPLEAQLRTEE
jgi:hypothetical protein